ncbi:amino acid permease [Geobacillus subterraneus]|uniref:amino acid permease n=1 Tax=Geobacillus subterraneus TaxID=129338 RepID=UPI00160AF23A
MRTKASGMMTWRQLALFGAGCTVGTGFFLGSGLAIEQGGPTVVAAFFIAATSAYIVFELLAGMTAADPEAGSFRSYAKKAYGPWAGFSCGWAYWCSELLIMGSQLTALAIFSRFWFPVVPLWLFTAGYAALGLIVLFFGTTLLSRIEHTLGAVKLMAVAGFVALAMAIAAGFTGNGAASFPNRAEDWMPNGARGSWSALIYAFYAFGGLEVLALMAVRLRDPGEAPKAGKTMLAVLAILYISALGLSLLIVPHAAFSGKESPFVTAVHWHRLPLFSHLFNAVFIIAGFSTMIASLFAVMTMITVLAEDGDAPRCFAAKHKRTLTSPAFHLTAAGLLLSVILALVMPARLYEYITSAAGLLLLYNWLFILSFAPRLLPLGRTRRWKRQAAFLFILLAVSGTVIDHEIRPGFFISLALVAAIAFAAFIRTRKAVRRRLARLQP